MSSLRLLAALLSMLVLAGLAVAQDATPPEDPATATAEEAPDEVPEGDSAEAQPEELQEDDLSEPATQAVTPVQLPEPLNLRVIDNPTDETNVGLTWQWASPPSEGVKVRIEARPSSDILRQYELSERDRNDLSRARESLQQALEPLLPQRDDLVQQVTAAQQELTAAEALALSDSDPTNLAKLRAARSAFWGFEVERLKVQNQIDRHRDAFLRKVSRRDLSERQKQCEYLSAAIDKGTYLPTKADELAVDLETQSARSDVFGRNPENPDWLYLEADSILAPAPGPLPVGHDEYDEPPLQSLTFDFQSEQMYVFRLVVSHNGTERFYDAGGGQPKMQLYNGMLMNGHVLAWSFAFIILGAIFLARRNPNLFIRRIAGLEAVDEAIGRATEMGKPVLYLNGMDTLTELSTLAAVNILGRVARRIADFDSDLLVPVRDPIVMTVAQEVVRSGYMDAGRPDAYREDNVFFVTQDQFSYTAAVCGIMLREKPAANFFMGYYYAESLLLAETGQSTGAIQIAGTDSTNQLPFFITTCDYTLIGEELYAASAYLSREPLLLGSLKGLDVAKLIVIIALLAQTALFLIDPQLDIIRSLFQPR